MKLFERARRSGVRYQTAWSWSPKGQMPVPVIENPTGHYLVVEQPVETPGRAVAYCRASSVDQRKDAERQAGRVVTDATARGVVIAQVVTKVVFGPNTQHLKLTELLAGPTVATIVVEHRERLAQFGAEHLEAALAVHCRPMAALHNDETGDELVSDLVRDMTEILTSFCTCLHGQDSAIREVKATLHAAELTA